MKFETITLMLKESNAIEEVYDEQSLHDSLDAWFYIAEQPELTIANILETHKILMRHQKTIHITEKGVFRNRPVWVGAREGKPYYALEEIMSDWVKKANMDATNYQIRKRHIQYEGIHPFADGNGRTGRIFMNWARVKNGIPPLIIYEELKEEYYRWFK